MKITGELLKNARLNQGLTVLAVSQALKLNQKIIIAIEAGDESQLPAKTFIRGFVKSYAQHLKLDSEAVLRQFQEEMGSTSPLPKVPPPPPATPDTIKASKPTLRQTSQNYSQDKSITSQAIREQDLAERNFNSKILIFLFSAAALVLVIVAATRFIEGDEVPVAQVSDSGGGTNVITPQYNTIDPESLNQSSDATALVNAISSDVTTNPNTTDATSATANLGTPLNVSQSQTPSTAVAKVPDDNLPPSSGQPIELVLEAKKDVEVFYARGNTRIFKSIKLTSQSVQIIRSATGLHIKAQDGGAFRITANGIDKGLAGANNKPVKLSF